MLAAISAQIQHELMLRLYENTEIPANWCQWVCAEDLRIISARMMSAPDFLWFLLAQA